MSVGFLERSTIIEECYESCWPTRRTDQFPLTVTLRQRGAESDNREAPDEAACSGIELWQGLRLEAILQCGGSGYAGRPLDRRRSRSQCLAADIVDGRLKSGNSLRESPSWHCGRQGKSSGSPRRRAHNRNTDPAKARASSDSPSSHRRVWPSPWPRWTGGR
jgi:hypothetical protein